MHYVYVLQSEQNGQFYIGITKDVRQRLNQHNAGLSDYTSKFRPWKLIYFEAYVNEVLARQRESKLKNHGKGFQELKKRILDEKGEG